MKRLIISLMLLLSACASEACPRYDAVLVDNYQYQKNALNLFYIEVYSEELNYTYTKAGYIPLLYGSIISADILYIEYCENAKTPYNLLMVWEE